MNIRGYVLIIMGFFSFKNAISDSAEDKFWAWFQKNENKIFHFENDQETIFNELGSRMGMVNSDLTFEFGPVNEQGKREFVISAGGIKSSFPAVESLYSSAPNLNNWIFIKYRPRRNSLSDIDYGGVIVTATSVKYKMFKDNDKVGIIVFIKGYNKKQKNIYDNIGYLLLDEALGEYDIETKVGFIEFHGHDSQYYEGAQPIKYLAEAFDEYFEKQ